MKFYSSRTYDPVPKSPLHHDYAYSRGEAAAAAESDSDSDDFDPEQKPQIVTDEEHHPSSSKKRSNKRTFLPHRLTPPPSTLILLTFLLPLLLWSLLLRPPTLILPSSLPLTSHCGSNATQALSLGCQFDLLAGSWTPSHCIDNASLSEFRTWITSPQRLRGAFPYFKDMAGTQRFRNEEELAWYDGEKTVWTTWEEHRWHCAMLMRRWHRAWLGMGRPNSRLGRLEHTMHCSRAVEEGLRRNEDAGWIVTEFQVSFESC